ncbi:MAG: hypothetical protein V3R64_09360 [Sphingomonadales bacterium]
MLAILVRPTRVGDAIRARQILVQPNPAILAQPLTRVPLRLVTHALLILAADVTHVLRPIRARQILVQRTPVPPTPVQRTPVPPTLVLPMHVTHVLRLTLVVVAIRVTPVPVLRVEKA